MQKAIVIVPTYNEKDNIKQLIPILFEEFQKIKNWDMHVLVVDDTSPDKTYEEVEKLQKQYKKLHLLINPQKAGLGGAYLKGMKHAFTKLDASVVFEFDADLSHDPTKIPVFLKEIDAGADMVIGSRYIPGGGIPDDWGFHRKLMSVLGNIVAQTVLTNFKIKDWTGGFRAIRKEVYDTVAKQLNAKELLGYTFQIGFLYAAISAKFRIVEVPFKFVDRTMGESKLPLSYMKDTLHYMFKLRFSEILQNRIFKFVIVGGIGASVQLVMANLLPLFISFETMPLKVLPDFLAIEIAVLSNFILSNIWTFSDRKLDPNQYIKKFLAFNFASGGSILIQTVLIAVGIAVIGLVDLFTLPIVGFAINSRTIFHVLGILIGMFWNFFAYNTFIWKKK